MKFSIVTISFNQAAYLEKAITSVLRQTGVELEYIVVDPGSSDGSRDILARHGEAITHLILEKDKGPADGLNKGFAQASGDVLAFLNADDEFLDGALAHIAEAFTRHPTADVVCGCGYRVNAEGTRQTSIVPTVLTPWQYVHGAVTLFQQGTFFRREAYLRAGGFNIDNRTCWDGELFLDMALAGARFVTIDQDVANFRVHDQSISGTGRLNAPYELDLQRLFVKATGRPRQAFDALIDRWAHLMKFLTNPAYLSRKIKRRLCIKK